MSKEGQSKRRGNPSISVRLPPGPMNKLLDLARQRTGGDVSALIRQLIETDSEVAAASLSVEEFWPIVVLVSAILDRARLDGRSGDDHIIAIRHLYELLLERCIPITGVDQ